MKLTSVCCLVLSLISVRCVCQAENVPDPKALLNGVASFRMQSPPSRLLIQFIYQDATLRNQFEYVVLFDGDRRLYVRTNSVSRMRMLWDGKDVLRFDGSGSVTLRNLDTLTSDFLTDPRTLGICTSFEWDISVSDAVHLDAQQIECVGRESIGGEFTWHVRVGDQYDRTFDLWIDDGNNFAVRRFEVRNKSGSRRIARSSYELPDYPWIPGRVEVEEYDTKGTFTSKYTVRILSAKADIRIPERTWTLAGLLDGIELPTWTPVFDVRTKQEVGWWRDGRLGPPRPWEPKPEAPRWTPKRFGVVILMILLLVGPSVVLGFRYARRRADQRR